MICHYTCCTTAHALTVLVYSSMLLCRVVITQDLSVGQQVSLLDRMTVLMYMTILYMEPPCRHRHYNADVSCAQAGLCSAVAPGSFCNAFCII